MMRSSLVIAGAALAFALAAGSAAAQTKLLKFETTAETTIRGTIAEVIAVTDADGNVGVHMTVKTAQGLVAVRVGPAMYIGINNFSFFVDDDVEVMGSAMAPRTAAFIAKQVTYRGRILTLRDETGAPVWDSMLEGSDGCGVQHVANADGTN